MEPPQEGKELELMDNFDQLALEQIEESASINPSAVPQAAGHNKTPLLQREEKNRSRRQDVPRFEKGVEDNPQYFRVDLELSAKLYEIYSRLKVGTEEYEGLTFDQKGSGNKTMNYHKVMQMLKDVEFRLEIAQKLAILRSIKKFSFNHNFISQEQFTKVFKVIVHGLGIKEQTFRAVVNAKYPTITHKQSHLLLKKPITIKLNKNFKKLKTQPTLHQQQLQSAQHTAKNRTLHAIDKSAIQNVREKTIVEESEVSTARRVEHRKRIVTEVSRYQPPKRSYLNRALQKNKLNIVSWDSLFKMTQSTLNPNISIPSFVSKDVRMDDIYF